MNTNWIVIMALVMVACSVSDTAKVSTSSQSYVVRSGDTLSKIARQFGVSVSSLRVKNNLQSDLIFPGQEITVGGRQKIQSLSSQPRLKLIHPVSDSKSFILLSDPAMRYSVDSGSEVFAAADGEVVYVGEKERFFDKLVIIKHRDNYMTVYGHLNQIKVRNGQRIKAGERIALSSDQMYFNFRHRAKSLDPRSYLR